MKKLLFAITSVVLWGCQGDLSLPAAPDDLIEKDSMVVLLKDMSLLESAVQLRYQNVTTYYKIMGATGRNYLKDQHVDPKRFERSYDYYVAHETELMSIYEQVLDSLNADATRLQAK
jgi:hypothetical protein